MGKLTKSAQRRVTIKDIAAMAGVSIGTVDRVLHNRGEVNQATHERVMSFVDELGYTPNLLAKSLALKKVLPLQFLYLMRELIIRIGKNLWLVLKVHRKNCMISIQKLLFSIMMQAKKNPL